MDITIDVEDYKLNVRAAGVIIHNGKVLAHRNSNSNHYALIGGRVEIGEDSANTIKREIKNVEEKIISKIVFILSKNENSVIFYPSFLYLFFIRKLKNQNQIISLIIWSTTSNQSKLFFSTMSI